MTGLSMLEHQVLVLCRDWSILLDNHNRLTMLVDELRHGAMRDNLHL